MRRWRILGDNIVSSLGTILSTHGTYAVKYCEQTIYHLVN